MLRDSDSPVYKLGGIGGRNQLRCLDWIWSRQLKMFRKLFIFFAPFIIIVESPRSDWSEETEVIKWLKSKFWSKWMKSSNDVIHLGPKNGPGVANDVTFACWLAGRIVQPISAWISDVIHWDRKIKEAEPMTSLLRSLIGRSHCATNQGTNKWCHSLRLSHFSNLLL
jgi:hypothetical protein